MRITIHATVSTRARTLSAMPTMAMTLEDRRPFVAPLNATMPSARPTAMTGIANSPKPANEATQPTTPTIMDAIAKPLFFVGCFGWYP
jgi:hypothetical protein